MATVKKANVAPTHPTVYVGLALATVGLLIAIYAYTGTRVYDIRFATVAGVGAFLALAGIMVAAWGRSIMASRAGRARRAAISKDVMSIAAPPAEESSQEAPTIAAPAEKKRFSFPVPKRAKKEDKPAEPAGVFAFRRRQPEPERAQDDPRNPAVAERLASEEPIPAAPAEPAPVPADPVRATLKCPQCGTTFTVEGVRPFEARCAQCGFSSTV